MKVRKTTIIVFVASVLLSATIGHVPPLITMVLAVVVCALALAGVVRS